MNFQDILNKRCLLKISNPNRFTKADVTEFKVLEISPSGAWVKLLNLNGYKFWRAGVDISFVEELVDLNAGKPVE